MQHGAYCMRLQSPTIACSVPNGASARITLEFYVDVRRVDATVKGIREIRKQSSPCRSFDVIEAARTTTRTYALAKSVAQLEQIAVTGSRAGERTVVSTCSTRRTIPARPRPTVSRTGRGTQPAPTW